MPDSSTPASRSTYTHGHDAPVLRSHSMRTIANSAAYAERHLVPGARVLDVGCGPGTITAEMADRVGAQGHVVGIDPSPTAIDEARRRAGDRANLTLAVGDVMTFQDDGGGFDLVHAHQVLQHLADPVAALAAMRRLCRPGGVVAVRDADYRAFAWAPGDPLLDRWLELYDAIARGNGGEPDAGRFLRGWAFDAGFTEVTSSASIWCFADEESRTWWSQTLADRVATTDLAQHALARGLADQDELDAIADAWRDWGRLREACFSVPHFEAVCRA